MAHRDIAFALALGGDLLRRGRGVAMKRRITITNTPTRINIGNLVQRLRRIRTELAQMTQQVDDALARIDGETSA